MLSCIMEQNAHPGYRRTRVPDFFREMAYCRSRMALSRAVTNIALVMPCHTTEQRLSWVLKQCPSA